MKPILILTWILKHSWDYFGASHISIQILGSQESNSLNGSWIEVEMKKLWSVEENNAKVGNQVASP